MGEGRGVEGIWEAAESSSSMLVTVWTSALHQDLYLYMQKKGSELCWESKSQKEAVHGWPIDTA